MALRSHNDRFQNYFGFKDTASILRNYSLIAPISFGAGFYEGYKKGYRDMASASIAKANSNTYDGEILLRELPLSKAKEEIAHYFLENDGREIGYDELIEHLRIDPRVLIQACAELEEEGKIG